MLQVKQAGFTALHTALYPQAMTRFLLAFLALLGIVAQTAPAEARIRGAQAAEIGLVVRSASEITRTARVQAGQAAFAPTLPGLREVSRGGEAPAASVPVATVRLKVDRARE